VSAKPAAAHCFFIKPYLRTNFNTTPEEYRAKVKTAAR
jgi:predicted transcriptional regulator